MNKTPRSPAIIRLDLEQSLSRGISGPEKDHIVSLFSELRRFYEHVCKKGDQHGQDDAEGRNVDER